jgi:hypothetical protein
MKQIQSSPLQTVTRDFYSGLYHDEEHIKWFSDRCIQYGKELLIRRSTMSWTSTGRGDVAPRIRDVGTGCRWMISVTLRLLNARYPVDSSPSGPKIRSWRVAKRNELYREPTPIGPTYSQSPLLTELSRLTQCGSMARAWFVKAMKQRLTSG